MRDFDDVAWLQILRPRPACIFMNIFHLAASGSSAAIRCSPGDGTLSAQPAGVPVDEQVAGVKVLDARKLGQRLGRPVDEVRGRCRSGGPRR